MTSFKLFGAALVVSTAFATPVFAQVEVPGDYAFFHPLGELGSSGPADATAFQTGRVNVGGLRLPTRPRRAHHISSTRAP
jgi:hypothetical protein